MNPRAPGGVTLGHSATTPRPAARDKAEGSSAAVALNVDMTGTNPSLRRRQRVAARRRAATAGGPALEARARALRCTRALAPPRSPRVLWMARRRGSAAWRRRLLLVERREQKRLDPPRRAPLLLRVASADRPRPPHPPPSRTSGLSYYWLSIFAMTTRLSCRSWGEFCVDQVAGLALCRLENRTHRSSRRRKAVAGA